MQKDEVSYWNQAFNLTNVVLDDTKEGKLFVPDLSIENDRMIEGESVSRTTDYQSMTLVPPRGRRVRINLNPGKGANIPEGYIYPFTPEGMNLTVKPKLNLGGMSYDPELYKAFINLEFKVFNKYGLPVLDMIPRTERVSSWMGPEVYSPYNPISAICGFNTKIYKNEQNKVTAVDRPWNGG